MIHRITLYRSDITGRGFATPDRSPAGPQCSGWRRDLLYSQLTQGLDTDSFGATAGSLLGAFFGPGHLDERWLAPFNDEIHTALAWFYEQSLLKVAKRMGELPRRIAAEIMDAQ